MGQWEIINMRRRHHTFHLSLFTFQLSQTKEPHFGALLFHAVDCGLP